MRRLRVTRRSVAAAVAALGLCLLLIAPVLVFGGLTMRNALDDHERDLDAERGRIASLAASLVERSMASRANQLLQLGARDDVRDAFARPDGARLAALLDPVIAGRPDVATALALDSGGRLLMRIPEDPAAIGQSFADRDYVAGSLATDQVHVSRPLVSRIDPSLVVVVLAHAVRQEGRPVGIAILTVRPSVLVQDLQAALDAPGREILLVDQDAGTIASTAARPVFGRLGVPVAGAGDVVEVGGMTREHASAAVAGTGWSLHVLDNPAALYAERSALAGRVAGPIAAALAVSGILAALLASAYLMLVRQRERLAAANERLVSANTEIEAATRAKSDFLASMSHELRTPLNAVLGFSDVLAEQLHDTLSERQTRYLANIHAAGAHLLELINDVLDLSKVEAGRLVLRVEVLPLRAVLEPVVASAAQLAADRGVRFDAAQAGDAAVRVDPARVRQMLLNLLSNAVKFTPAGGSVSLRATARGDDLRFEVADTGIGIPQDRRERVFGVFERLHEGRSEAPGTGLGLAITKRLVELHGGEIGFASAEGSGSTFWVELPGVVVAAVDGARLLVVEDEPRDAELVAHLAREAGLRVEIAPSAASGLSAIARSAPTAVVLDLRLPDRRGEEVLRSLKSDPATAGIPVLVVTVEDDDGQARLAGASDHLTKPIDRERLRGWLARIARADAALARAVT